MQGRNNVSSCHRKKIVRIFRNVEKNNKKMTFYCFSVGSLGVCVIQYGSLFLGLCRVCIHLKCIEYALREKEII